MERLTQNTKKNPKTELDILNEMNSKLDKLIGILVIQNIKNIDDKIHTLKNLKFKSDEVGPLVGIKGTSVRDKEGWKRK